MRTFTILCLAIEIVTVFFTFGADNYMGDAELYNSQETDCVSVSKQKYIPSITVQKNRTNEPKSSFLTKRRLFFEKNEDASLNQNEVFPLKLLTKYIQINTKAQGEKAVSSDVVEISEDNSTVLKIKNILQKPELPTGCEITSLAILLNYQGIKADKNELAEKYLPKQQFYVKNNVLYGADINEAFAGDPTDASSFGCYAPCITKTANLFLKDKGSKLKAYDISKTSIEILFTQYIDKGQAVIIWITSDNLHPSRPTKAWETPKGKKIQWISYEHCVVLRGYDRTKNKVYVSDPLYGSITYDMTTLSKRYTELGKQCVCIK